MRVSLSRRVRGHVVSAIMVFYIAAILTMTGVMCSAFLTDGEIALWMVPVTALLAVMAWPLGKVTDRLLEH